MTEDNSGKPAADPAAGGPPAAAPVAGVGEKTPAPSGADENKAPKNFPRVTAKALGWAAFAVVLTLAMVAGIASYVARNSSNYWNPARAQEWRSAAADHEMIATAIAACLKVFDLDSQPESVRVQLRVDFGPDGVDYPLRKLTPKPDQAPPTTSLNLTNYQRAAIYFSDAIMRARTDAAATAASNYSTMTWFQIAIVMIGAITTILISVKSIASPDENQTLFFWTGIFAIIFSAVGTASSSLNAFYGPRETYLKSERALSALQQLHSDVAANVTSGTGAASSDSCPSFDPNNPEKSIYGKQVQDWSAKLSAIVTATDAGSSNTPTGASQGTTGSPAAVGSPPGSED